MRPDLIRPDRSINRFRADTEFQWPLVEMSDVVTLNYGRALKEGDRRPGFVPVYGTNGRTGWHDTPLGPGPTVILGRKGMGNLGVEWCEGPFWVIDTAYFVSFREDVLPRFFYYFTNYVGLNHLKDGTSNPSLSRDTFSRQWFPLPPVDEQKRIAEFLAALDDKIAVNRQTNETLEAMAQAIYRDWFVDYGPTRAKAAGRPAYLAPEIWEMFPDTLDDAGKPSGWRRGSVSDVASQSKTAMSPSLFPEERFDHYSLPAYDDGQMPVSQLGATILSNKTEVPTGAILLSKLNPEIPRVWLTPQAELSRQICSTEFLAFCANGKVARAYVYLLFLDRNFRDRLQGMVTGTSKSHQRVSPQSVLDIEIVLPPGDTEILEAFSTLVDPLLLQVIQNRQQCPTLATMRDLALPKLMSGEVRLKNGDKKIEEAL
jgi:type I restriction enzyme S subunit